MTAALSDAYPPPGGWTTDDLDDVPEDGRRRELLDGVLIMSPSPTLVHQIIAGRLMVALEETCPPEYVVGQGVEVRINRHRALIPDVLVATDDAVARNTAKLQPHEVILAVEIVSASSITMDRVAKPALYAQAGIPFYWRIETFGGFTLHAYEIDAQNDVYRATGEFTEAIEVSRPWPIKLPIKRLIPKHFQPEG